MAPMSMFCFVYVHKPCVFDNENSTIKAQLDNEQAKIVKQQKNHLKTNFQKI